MLRGEAGSGKTALLEYLLERASGCRTVRATGVESEMELAFAGLHQLCAPMLDRLGHLPRPQGDALGTAFGLSSGEPPDRFLVGLAVLGLLAEVAEDEPLVCLVDDAQWLDRASEQALAFVARRLLAERVALVFAVRETGKEEWFAGLPELVVEGLGDDDARALLDSAIPGRLDERVRERIVAEARGNPLALLELPHGLSPAELAGGFGLPGALPLSGRIEKSFRQRVERLPAESQRLLVVAAAEPIGDPALLWRAAERLSLGAEDAGPAEAAGLLTLDRRVTFRHPLLRSVIYRAASAEERRRAHDALALATDPQLDPDRRAWHRAQATIAPDEEVAAELERSADRARARGGLAAAAAFLDRAATHTPEPARRAQRALDAAQAEHVAGAPGAALRLLATAEEGPLDELQRARLERLRAQIVFASSRGSEAPALLLTAAKRLEPLDAGLARETYLDALGAAIFAGRLSSGRGLLEVAEAARVARPAPTPGRTIDLLLDGLATRFTGGYAAGLPPLRQALHALSQADGRTGDALHWLWLACRIAPDLWDDEAWHVLSTRQLQLARDAGALTVLPFAATYRGGVHVHAGEFAEASALVEEADVITEVTGNAPLMYTSIVLAAWRGREAQALELIEASRQDATNRGEGRAIALAEYATAVLYNGLGRYQTALAGAQQVCEYDDLGLFGWALIELVEAAARSREPQLAASALDQLSERTRLSGSNWALGVESRSRALVSAGDAAERLYREAIELLGHSRVKVHLARAHLVYGEWLRRENRRIDAREQLRTAHEMFAAIGAEAFGERAARELLATGERARRRVETRTRADRAGGADRPARR